MSEYFGEFANRRLVLK